MTLDLIFSNVYTSIGIGCLSGFVLWYSSEPLIFKSDVFLQYSDFMKYIRTHKYKYIASSGYILSLISGSYIGYLRYSYGMPVIQYLYKS